MNYEWDPKKAKSNYKKHGVRFADAVGVFEDENAITIEDEYKGEARFITIGRDFLSRILVVVYTFRDIVIRIISARKATARERTMYEDQNEEGI
ncbi:MAG TPA: BrnT family toxin [Anaerolineales bacterium]|nr:BrnT family toxin [Anaerolineales bacterium]